jgi:hypothetical protein
MGEIISVPELIAQRLMTGQTPVSAVNATMSCSGHFTNSLRKRNLKHQLRMVSFEVQVTLRLKFISNQALSNRRRPGQSRPKLHLPSAALPQVWYIDVTPDAALEPIQGQVIPMTNQANKLSFPMLLFVKATRSEVLRLRA